MLHSKGDLQEAINVARQNVAKVKNSKDLRLKIRCDIALAMLYVENSLEHVAASMLRECQTAAQIHSLENIDAMINRRLAYIDVVEGRIGDALVKIKECEWIVTIRCPPLEKALFYMTMFAACKKQEYSSPAARREFHHAGVPLLEKAAIAEAAKLYNSYNRITERDECATLFCEIQARFPGQISWPIL
ncbi:unnamed protein product [Gongylonema pulchrum]|uniref:14_3_3 domain-containing protein n=1 Tax=Gongylonema pulchrum TaxID=637853 RepID=A0A183D1R6_9BILA|nr:unnamed protein product [Gongylonema pulchrum]